MAGFTRSGNHERRAASFFDQSVKDFYNPAAMNYV